MTAYMVKAFNFHNSSTPDSSLTTALPGTMRREAERRSGKLPGPNLRLQEFRSTTRNLVSLLPPREVAALLVDTYFDRAHWFTLIFMQEEFRQKWEAMYDSPREQLIDASGSSNPAFISTFLVVIAIALRYTGSYRQRLLRESGVDAVSLEEGIVSALRVNMLDIVSLGSLEAVQTCVLLGTHYLYHGRPGLAWPVCGLGLRLAQALNLHRMPPTTEAMTPDMQSQYETRKRCWWAIYEIETFCSMSYGYPHAIKDADCDVELLDPLARTSAGQSPASFSTTHQCPASLLSYKYLMSKLSILIKDTLTGLYGIGSFKGGLQNTRSENSAGLRNLIKRASTLDSRLQSWKMEIPDLLRLDKLGNSLNTTYTSVEEMDQDIRANGPGFETHIYQLQALTLELAYENARILVHRPLLTYKMAPRKESQNKTDTEPQQQDPFQASLQACREAALKTAEIGSTPIFSLAADTYAVTFISIHTFTAGVMLCILASIEPLTVHSHASKSGLRQLLNMQRHLKATARSSLASQGLEILERLTRLVMDKELKEMLAGPVNEQASYSSDEQQQSDQIRAELEGAAIQGQVSDEEFMFNYDPAMSKALFDFDQGK